MKSFKKYYTIWAPLEDVYLALTNPATIHLWSGEEAVMSTEPQTQFSLWEGSIVGKNLEFVENKMIKQEWFFDQDDQSIVTILLHPHPKGTSVELSHSNIPDADYDDIVTGWNTVYFGALQDFYG